MDTHPEATRKLHEKQLSQNFHVTFLRLAMSYMINMEFMVLESVGDWNICPKFYVHKMCRKQYKADNVYLQGQEFPKQYTNCHVCGEKVPDNIRAVGGLMRLNNE